jgi:hypothetical protein
MNSLILKRQGTIKYWVLATGISIKSPRTNTDFVL